MTTAPTRSVGPSALGLAVSKPIQALIIEDSGPDCELTIEALRHGGFDVDYCRVDSQRELEAALDRSNWDVILADYQMPGFDGMTALSVTRERGIDTPFIFVSGVLGEERAVEAMRAGARDYVVKDNLARLSVAVRRELMESESRRSRVAIEHALRAQERRYRNMFDAASAALIELDFGVAAAWLERHHPRASAGELACELQANPLTLAHVAERIRIVDANAEALRLFDVGVERENICTLADILRPASRPAFAAVIAGVLRPSGTIQCSHDFETLAGRRIHALISAKVTGEQDLEHVPISIVDITERRSLEDQMRAAQRLESIGRLAGGIAHDFNNLLLIIQSSAQFLEHKFGSLPAVRLDLQMILESTQRAADLTRQLLTFSRQQPLTLGVIDPNEAVRALSILLGRLVGVDVELCTELSSDAGGIAIDRSQFEQVVMNLVVNARDALPDGGRVVIRVTPEQLSGGGPLALPEAEYVRVSVVDTGIGMDERTQARVFEPFFTTKGGNGTGLGLSTVYGIAKQAGGAVRIDSELGHGTTVDVFFPVARREDE
jgi:signal transduction histidine kinase